MITKNHLAAFSAIFLWSTAFLGVKTGLQYAPPLLFAGIRFTIAGLLIAPFCGGVQKIIQHTRQHWKTVILVMLFQTYIMYGCYYMGISRVPASIAAIVMGTGPLFSAMTAHLLLHDDKMSLKKIVSLFLGFIGIAIISSRKDPGTAAGASELTGIVLLLIASILESLANVIVKKHPTEPLPLTSMQLFLGGLLLTVTSFITETPTTHTYPPIFYISLAWLSFVSAAGFSIWFSIIQKKEIKVSELNLLKFLIPVIGATLSWLLLANEQPDIKSLAGMLLIASSVLVFFRKNKKKLSKIL